MTKTKPFEERKDRLFQLKQLQNKTNKAHQSNVPKNLFVQCVKCGNSTTGHALSKSLYICEKCGFHFKIAGYYRLSLVLDSGTFKEMDRKLVGNNPIDFPDYNEKLKALQNSTRISEAVVTATGKINGIRAVVCALDSHFLMGSMGVAVGEKLTRAIEYATKNKLPLIIFSASGGARMQEGIFSLMQMAKTAAAIERHHKAGLLYISVLTNPTTGGVTASFASLGDIILAEPGALIGFAGPRVIEQTIKQKLPEGFQTSEYLLEHGFLDSTVVRKDLKSTLTKLLLLHHKRGKNIC
ncbi:MAG: acetyl-CoA carboxylase, carboxyltransferase subunit beta [Angelakisella sp.]